MSGPMDMGVELTRTTPVGAYPEELGTIRYYITHP